MDMSNSEIDAQLIEQFSSLVTDDRDELIRTFNRIVGSNVPTGICQFFLDMANWNLSKAIGAYFDFNFEANIDPVESSAQSMFQAKFHPSPHSGPKNSSPLIWCVQNCGSTTWPPGAYLTVETQLDLSSVSSCDRSVIWVPVPPDYRSPVTELTPGSYAHLVVEFENPPNDLCQRALSTNTPIVGAFKLCRPNGERFGDLLYCTLIPQLETHTVLFRAAAPDAPILPPEPHGIPVEHMDPPTSQQPMEEDL